MLFALGAISPWLSLVDEAKYSRYVDRVQSLDITTIAGCHTPVIEGPFIDRAFARIRELPSLDPPQLPDQSVLDQLIADRAAGRLNWVVPEGCRSAAVIGVPGAIQAGTLSRPAAGWVCVAGHGPE